MKILLTRKLHDFALEKLKEKYEIVIYSGEMPIPKEELKSKIDDIDGLVCFPGDIISKEVIDCAKNLKVISTCSVGYDHIDLKHAKMKKIRVGYTPDILTDATADLTMALILDVARRVTEGDRCIRMGGWTKIYQIDENLGIDLRGKTLGILGMGRIGMAVAKRAKSFGMNIIYHNRRRLSGTMAYVSLSNLIKDSDIISIHVPHSKETHHMFNSVTFQKMKNSAILINTARGKIVNQKDLTVALKERQIAGAGLDVFEIEPIPKDDPLINQDNVVLVPHSGSSTIHTRREMSKITIENLELGLNGKDPIYSIGFYGV